MVVCGYAERCKAIYWVMSSSKLPSVSAPTGIAEELQEAVRKGALILQVNTTLHTRAHAHRHRNAPPYSLHQPAAYPCIMRGHWSSKAPPFHPPTRMGTTGTKPPFPIPIFSH